MTLAIIIFLATLIFLVMERVSGSIVAMLGAFAVVFFGILDQCQAISFIDFNTIGLLCGMMIVVVVLRKTGIFEYLAIKAIKQAKGEPWKLLVSLALTTAVLSAFLDNVTTVLIIAPITFAIADALKVNPVPYLIAEIFFSNLGGTATLIGDPPNIMIGTGAGLGFMEFIYNDLPAVFLISFFVLFALKKIYYKQLICTINSDKIIDAFDESKAIQGRRRFLAKSLLIFTLIIFGFMTHSIHKLDLAAIALGGAFMMMFFTGADPEEMFKEVEWSSLFFFMGLFIVVGGLDYTGFIAKFANGLINLTGGSFRAITMTVLWFSGLSTTIVNSIPFTATMISVVKSIARVSNLSDIKPIWWALSLGACLGGNGTLVSAAANIVVAGIAKRSNYPISFWEYFKVGFPLMVGTIILATIYIYLRYLL